MDSKKKLTFVILIIVFKSFETFLFVLFLLENNKHSPAKECLVLKICGKHFNLKGWHISSLEEEPLDISLLSNPSEAPAAANPALQPEEQFSLNYLEKNIFNY